jgi:hypothetical protein
MAIVVDQVATLQAGAGTTISVTGFTVNSASGQILCVPVWYVDGGGQPSAVVWDAAGVNESLTLLKRQREGVTTGNAVDLWYRLNPTAGSSKTVTITLSSSVGSVGGAFTVTGAANSSAAAAFRDVTLTGDTADTEGGAADPATVTVAGATTGDLIVDVMLAASEVAIGANQAQIYDDNSFGPFVGASAQAGSAGGVMSWTFVGGSHHWAIAAVAIQVAAGGGSPWYYYAQQ